MLKNKRQDGSASIYDAKRRLTQKSFFPLAKFVHPSDGCNLTQRQRQFQRQRRRRRQRRRCLPSKFIILSSFTFRNQNCCSRIKISCEKILQFVAWHQKHQVGFGSCNTNLISNATICKSIILRSNFAKLAPSGDGLLQHALVCLSRIGDGPQNKSGEFAI